MGAAGRRWVDGGKGAEVGKMRSEASMHILFHYSVHTTYKLLRFAHDLYVHYILKPEHMQPKANFCVFTFSFLSQYSNSVQPQGYHDHVT